MSYIMSTKYARRDDPDFVIAMARAFYCDWYLQEDARRERVEGPGVELTEVIPETQRWAIRKARILAGQLSGSLTLDALLDRWREEAAQAAIERPHCVDREASDENLGWYAGMQMLGTGIGLECCGVDVELPYTEAYP